MSIAGAAVLLRRGHRRGGPGGRRSTSAVAVCGVGRFSCLRAWRNVRDEFSANAADERLKIWRDC